MTTKIIALIAVAAAAAFVFASCKGKKAGENQNVKADSTAAAAPKEAEPLAFDPATLPEEPVFDIVTTMGTIRVKLYKDTPKHRDNFVKLASEHFYDNILFHRVIRDFMIQCGDPQTKDPDCDPALYGQGGPGYTIPAEILPAHKHKKGALAAARKGDQANPNKESSGSQFYIVHSAANCAQLDGEYTVFGETISGLDVIDKIASVTTGDKDRPVEPVKIISVRPAAK